MFGVLMFIPVVAEAVDRLCDRAEEAERVSSKAYAEGVAVGEAIASAAPHLAERPFVGAETQKMTLPGVGTLKVTPNEAVALNGDPGSKEFRVALATALARRNAGM
jgi:hypothetical protein